MNNEVMVTLRAEGFSKDFILPTDVPLCELYPRLHKVLVAVNQRHFGGYSGVVLESEGAGLVNLRATLHDYGIRIGAYLDIAEKEKYHGFRG